MDRFFSISERGSNIRTEIIAGLTTFFALAYIVFVNPNQVAAEGAKGWLVDLGANSVSMGQIWNSVFVGSVLVAFLGTLLMALVAKMPFAQACGMGLNAFFCTCFVSGAFFAGVDVVTGYQSGLVVVFLSGLLFLLLTVTGARKYIALAMPDCLKKSIPSGIGLFIAFIGFQNAGIIQANKYTLVQFVDIHGGKWDAVAPALVALIGFIIIAILAKLQVKGNVIIGIFASTVLYYLFMGQTPSFDLGNIKQSFIDFGNIGLAGVFHKEAWTTLFTGAHVGGVFNAVILVITFCLVEMFDTIGTLYGTASQAKMTDENGDPIRLDQSMLCDSIATFSGAMVGASPAATFVESYAGIAAGGRTGLSSLVTSGCLLACLFLSPLASIIPSAATAPALIYVGVLMLKGFSHVDMEDLRSAVPAFLTLVMMPLTYSISNGIGIGAISYVLISLFTGKFTKKDAMITIVAFLFVLKFIFVTM
jgi:AGZA family xanthine/uracil permease-like MFS transporter